MERRITVRATGARVKLPMVSIQHYALREYARRGAGVAIVDVLVFT